MKFLSLPKIGQHIAEKKEDTIEDPAFVNAQKVWRLVKRVLLICSDRCSDHTGYLLFLLFR